MKLKLVQSFLIICGLLLSTGVSFAAVNKIENPSSLVYQAINKYKAKNYTGCIQDMDYLIKMGKPSDLVYYYRAISYAQLKMQTQARENYEMAANITKNTILKDYANQAIACIDDETLCDMSLDDGDITKFIKSEKFMHTDVEKGLQDKAIQKAKEEINNNINPGADTLKYINQNHQPTDKEIADAVRTFQKMGINPFQNGNLGMFGQNSEIAQMSAMFGNNNNNNNNMMNLIPMINAMQSQSGNNTNMNKEFIQSYMMNQMLPNFNFNNSDK